MANIVPDSFKQQLFLGTHNFSTSAGNTFQLALYSTVSGFTASGTTAYTTTNEASGTGYSAGGLALTNTAVSVASNIAFVDFSDVTFSTATITASAALIYNTTVAGTPAVVVLDFGGDKTSTNGDFTIQFPDANSTSAILRIS
jgi:uncharacterized protein (DUF1684 family)